MIYFFDERSPVEERNAVIQFIEQCENFLSLRPLPHADIMATLSTVLVGPAHSWWTAEKTKIKKLGTI